MCPLRVILLFLSAILAGYFAFKSVSSAQGDSSGLSLSGEEEPEQVVEDQAGNILAKVSAGFWVVVDMLSGRYLYHTLRGGQTTTSKVATS